MDSSVLWSQLERVLDPELDESIVRLGFVRHVDWDGRRACIVLRLPTYWCSPNFAYLMLDGIRRAVLSLPGVESVQVELEDHFASGELSAGVSAGRTFREIFPEEASEELEELRQRLLMKGYLSRLLVLIQALRATGAREEELVAASLGQLVSQGEHAWLRTEGGERGPIRRQIVDRYLGRRAELGLPMTPDAPLVLRPDGQAIPSKAFSEELRRMRATVINLRASTALCEALLASRQQWWDRERKEVAR